MTEAEWLAATDPMPMLKHLRGEASDRKLRLVAVACCRRIWHLLTDERSRIAVDLAERDADGLVRETDLRESAQAANEAYRYGNPLGPHDNAAYASVHVGGRDRWHSASSAAAYAAYAVRYPVGGEEAKLAEQAHQTSLLRDIFGNPFRPVAIDPSWLTTDVRLLATGIYDDKAFDRMPILADALQDAGCTNDDILSHCRSEGPHVRGCWVVDLLLGKE